MKPTSIPQAMAAVGLLRLISETTTTGRGHWAIIANRYRFVIENVPETFSQLCSQWIAKHRSAFEFGEADNVNFDGAFWRKHATEARGIGAELWAAIASDGVWTRDGKRLRASRLEYGGGRINWLSSLRGFIARGVTPEAMAVFLRGERNEDMPRKMGEGLCQWDPTEREHAYRAKAPTEDRMTQDQTINALAAIGLASCPSAPTRNGLVIAIAEGRDALTWPVWTEPIRSAELEAALCCGWTWPTMHSERKRSEKYYRFLQGCLREP